MNLYRSFGNLMEAWVSEGGQCSYSECLGNNDEDSPTPSSHMGTNLRSESVDSGVETASSDMSFPVTSSSVSADNTEIDTFTPEKEGDRLSQALTSQSPVLSSPPLSSSSSSSPRLCPSRAQEDSTALHHKVEQALQRTHSNHLKEKPEALTVDEVLRRQSRASSVPLTVDEVLRRQSRASSVPLTVDEVLRRQSQASSVPLTVDEVLRRQSRASSEPLAVDEVLRRRPRASFQPKRHTSELVRGQMSQSFVQRKMVNPLLPMSQMRRRPVSMISNKQPAQTRLEDLGEEEGKGLSPGLNYLEQVCQMLEEIAQQQMHTQALQMEMNAPREQQDVEDLDARQSDSRAAEEELSSCQRLENKESADHISSEPQQRKDYHQRHFRQRSASDTTIATLHLRRLNADCRGQHLSTDDLLEKLEEDHNQQESKKEKTNTIGKSWKFKIGSLRREGSAVREANGQLMQPSEKNSARRRLSQLFRRNRRKTLPV